MRRVAWFVLAALTSASAVESASRGKSAFEQRIAEATRKQQEEKQAEVSPPERQEERG